MAHYLIFDTETNGLPKNYKSSADDVDNWPRIIQLAYAIYDKDQNLVERVCDIIKPDGWRLMTPEEAYNDGILRGKSHADAVAGSTFWERNGFTMERLEAEGIPISDAIMRLIKHRTQAKVVIAHNMAFDSKIVRAEIIRLGISIEFTGEKICTMAKSTSFCRLPSPNGRGFKWPKLEELHQVLFKKGFEGAHDAGNDVDACAVCYFELKRLGIVA